MREPAGRGRAKASNSNQTVNESLAQLASGPTRLLVSHCPGCGDVFDENPPYVIGRFERPDLTRAIIYKLCKPCGRQIQNGGRKRRRILTERIERNLEEHGAFTGIVRTGMRA